jgi:hypothetical protein
MIRAALRLGMRSPVLRRMRMGGILGGLLGIVSGG